MNRFEVQAQAVRAELINLQAELDRMRAELRDAKSAESAASLAVIAAQQFEYEKHNDFLRVEDAKNKASYAVRKAKRLLEHHVGEVENEARSIPWSDHPMAALGHDILSIRILPMMGHNARDFARAVAVCKGFQAASREKEVTSIATYRETMLEKPAIFSCNWSPDGTYIVTTHLISHRIGSDVICIWRASTGKMVGELKMPPLSPGLTTRPIVKTAFSRDSTQLLTLMDETTQFCIWSVPDGRELIHHPHTDDDNVYYTHADFGVPNSASEGLVGFSNDVSISLWDVDRACLRGRVDFDAPNRDDQVEGFAFSPDGSKFAAAWNSSVYVYGVGSLELIGKYSFDKGGCAFARWMPNGRLLVSTTISTPTRRSAPHRGCLQECSSIVSAFVWDYTHNVTTREASKLMFHVTLPLSTQLVDWSPMGTTYFVTRHTLVGNSKYEYDVRLEERKVADNAIIRSKLIGYSHKNTRTFPGARLSPDRCAVASPPTWVNDVCIGSHNACVSMFE